MVMTPMSARFMTDTDALEKRKSMTASRRIGQAHEAAALMAFLASDASSYVNGQNIEVDGGLMQMMIRLLPRPGVKQAD
jgi:NAD(P)-dependent dehydrogenase (short-subunit alcohol dehydrogenase family)